MIVTRNLDMRIVDKNMGAAMNSRAGHGEHLDFTIGDNKVWCVITINLLSTELLKQTYNVDVCFVL